MDPLIRRRIYNLLCIKSIVTLALTGLFVFLAVTGQVSARDFITIFSIVIAFYFGTKSRRRRAARREDMIRLPPRFSRGGSISLRFHLSF